MLRLVVICSLITQILSSCSHEKSFIQDFEDMQFALEVATNDTLTWGKGILDSSINYEQNVEMMLKQVILELQNSGIDTTTVEEQVMVLNTNANETYNNLTSEVLNVQSQLDQIKNDLGDWIILTEEIDKYNSTWQYLPDSVDALLSDLQAKYVVVDESIQLLLQSLTPEESALISAIMYEIKKSLIRQAVVIKTGLNTCNVSADTLVTATRQYLTNFQFAK